MNEIVFALGAVTGGLVTIGLLVAIRMVQCGIKAAKVKIQGLRQK